jgi:hypothetical protein
LKFKNILQQLANGLEEGTYYIDMGHEFYINNGEECIYSGSTYDFIADLMNHYNIKDVSIEENL